MKKFAFSITGLVLVLLVTVLVGPNFVNWNDYKAKGAAWLTARTGRDVVINGDIKITLLPSPALIVSDVKMANIKGASSDDMVRLKSLEVRVALGPLLGGNIKVETIRLIEPVVEIEYFADGRNNLGFSAVNKNKASQETLKAKDSVRPDGAPKSEFSPNVQLDNFVIENGTIIYRNAKSTMVERIEQINARLVAASLSGPFESSGKLTVRGIPFGYDVSIGKIVAGNAVPLSLKLNDALNDSEIHIVGTALNIIESFKFKGKLKGKGSDLAKFITTTTNSTKLPNLLSQGFGFEGSVAASAKGMDVNDIAMHMGDVKATGGLSIRLGKTINTVLKIAVKNINMNQLPAMPISKSRPTAKIGTSESKATSLTKAHNASKTDRHKKTSKDGFSPPKNLNSAFNFSVESIIYQGGIIHDVRVNAELTNGEITISQLSAKLPGGTDVAVFGFITADKGRPRFEGEMETTVSDLRKLMSWMGQDKIAIPSDRLRKLTMSSKMVATPKQLQVSNLDIQFDSSRIIGGVTVAMRTPPAFGANLTLDRINLEAYLPMPDKPLKNSAKGKTTKNDLKKKIAEEKDTYKAVSPLGILSALKSFDANIKSHIKTLIYRGTPIKDIVIDATLFGGDIEVRRASIGKVAGASAMFSGKIKNTGVIPEMQNIAIEAYAPDVSRLFRLTGNEPPIDFRKLGKVTLKGRFNGTALTPSIDVNLKAAGADVTINGAASFLPIIGGFDGTLTARHKNLSRLLSALEIDYKPAANLGELDITAKVKGNASSIAIESVKGKVGPVNVAGTADIRLGDYRPKITANLNTSEIVIDNLLPTRRTPALRQSHYTPDTKPGVILASWRGVPPTADTHALRRGSIAAAYNGRWSTDVIDLSALKTFDADIKLKSPAIIYQKYKLDNADLGLTLNNGTLKVNKLTGLLFGGKLDVNAVVYAAATARIETTASINNMDIVRALGAVLAQTPASGKMGLNLHLTTTGRSVSRMVSALGGNGSISLKQVDVKKEATGTPLASALNLIAGLNSFGGNIGAAQKGAGMADISASFDINKGIGVSNDIKLVSKVGNGDAKGSVDLPQWLVDVNGKVQLSQNILTAILAQKTNMPTLLPFQIRGSLDNPEIKLDTSRMPRGGITLPGGFGRKIQKKLKKKGLGGLLNKVFPGISKGRSQAQPQTPSTTSPPPPPPLTQQQTRKKSKAKDIIKGILQGIVR